MSFHSNLESGIASLMRFIEDIKNKLDISWRELGRRTGVDYQRIRKWENSEHIKSLFTWLCTFRKESGESWKEFGERMDREFLDDDKE